MRIRMKCGMEMREFHLVLKKQGTQVMLSTKSYHSSKKNPLNDTPLLPYFKKDPINHSTSSSTTTIKTERESANSFYDDRI